MYYGTVHYSKTRHTTFVLLSHRALLRSLVICYAGVSSQHDCIDWYWGCLSYASREDLSVVSVKNGRYDAPKLTWRGKSRPEFPITSMTSPWFSCSSSSSLPLGGPGLTTSGMLNGWWDTSCPTIDMYLYVQQQVKSTTTLVARKSAAVKLNQTGLLSYRGTW